MFVEIAGQRLHDEVEGSRRRADGFIAHGAVRADDIKGAELDRARRIDAVPAIPFPGETVREHMPDVAPDKTKACAEAMPMDKPYRLQQAMLTEMGPCPAKTAERTILEAIPILAWHLDIRHATGSIPVDEHLLGYLHRARLRFPNQ
ncbi:hypothetical protein [Mesorhizobium sp. AR02]|uniref:hypothetical protein n=1 Tax=Mesorhizobium sp. AR02 TaxID=2865837 RepID=UPI00215EF196|nr:hypothetical protein [Mesorhizobium sp. AR02]